MTIGLQTEIEQIGRNEYGLKQHHLRVDDKIVALLSFDLKNVYVTTFGEEKFTTNLDYHNLYHDLDNALNVVMVGDKKYYHLYYSESVLFKHPDEAILCYIKHQPENYTKVEKFSYEV